MRSTADITEGRYGGRLRQAPAVMMRKRAHVWGAPAADIGEIEDLPDDQVAALRQFARARPDLWNRYFGDLGTDDDGGSTTSPIAV